MSNSTNSRTVMSVEEAKAHLKEALANNTGKNEAKYPTDVIHISKAFVKEFSRLVSKEERVWIATNMKAFEDKAKATKEEGEIKNPFSSFRNAFAKKYFPEWVKEKAPKAKKLSFLEELEALANEE